jgi:hypothetical protein
LKSPAPYKAAVCEVILWWTTPKLAYFFIYDWSMVVSQVDETTLRYFAPFVLVYYIWAWKGTVFKLERSIDFADNSSYPLTSYSNEILVFLVAFARSRSNILPYSLRLLTASFLNFIVLWSKTFILTLIPTTSSLRTFAKSSDSFSGLTTFMFPLVISASLPIA